jgi:hypothetical protein
MWIGVGKAVHRFLYSMRRTTVQMSQNIPSEGDSLLALALATGASINEAAQRAGVDRKTGQRKLADPEFRRQVCEIRGELIAATLGRMAGDMTRAADVLSKHMDDLTPSIRLCAIRAMLGFGLKMRDLVDMDQPFRDIQVILASEGYA